MSCEVTNVCGCTVLEAIPTVMYNSSELLKAMVIPVSSYGCFISWKRAYAWLLPQATQAHASRKRGIYKLFMVLEPGRDLRERPVLGYKRPLTI